MAVIKTFLKKPNFKELHVERFYPTVLEELVNYRAQERGKFEIFVYGFKYEHFQHFPENQKRSQWLSSHTEFLLQNLSLMAETVHSDYPVYFRAIDTVGEEVLERFLKKLKNVHSIVLDNDVKNEEHLLNFLFKIKPNILEFHDFYQYSDRFLNQLGSGGNFLQQIVIASNRHSKPEKLLCFILKLKNLTHLKICNGFLFRFVVLAFKVAQDLKSLTFKFPQNKLVIVNDWRTNAIGFSKNRPFFEERKKFFSNKSDCIQFFLNFWKFDLEHSGRASLLDMLFDNLPAGEIKPVNPLF